MLGKAVHIYPFVNEIPNLYFLNKGAESHFSAREMEYMLHFITYEIEYFKGNTGKYLPLPIIQNTIAGVDNLTFMPIGVI